MVFSSFQFLFLFLPIVLLVNRFLPLKASNVFLFIVSLVFYYVGEAYLFLLLVGSISWNYLYGLFLITKISRSASIRKTITGVCIAGNLLLLIYYKYLGFFIENLSLTEFIPESKYSSIVLPIGISFFTFQGISYIIDVYRKNNKIEYDPIKLGLFISFFPQLIAGPIVKYNEISEFLSNRTITIEKITKGSFKFIRGLAKKVILANSLAVIADLVFDMNTNVLPSYVAWLGLIAYSLQIYYDFSGYSDMAIGLCLILGFKIPENFNYPYISRSVKEFWQRWHISLSSWFKNYLYIPLGGNKSGNIRTYLNLILVFFITGLWHGASYNFIIWGMIHGAFLIIERIFPNIFNNMPVVLRHTYTLLGVTIAWVFFRIESLSGALSYIGKLFSFTNTGDFYPIIYLNKYYLFLFLIAVLFIAPIRKNIFNQSFNTFFKNDNMRVTLTCAFYLLIFVYSILELSIATHTPFIYFKF